MPTQNRFAPVVGILWLCCLTQLTQAAEVPDMETPQPMKKPPTTETSPISLPSEVPQPENHPSASDIWANLVAQQEAYVRRFAPPPELVVIPDLHFHLTAGVYFLQPHFESNPAFILIRQQTVGGVTSAMTSTPNLGYDATFAPRLSLTVAGESGLGLRTNWWHFDEDSHVVAAVNRDSTLNTLITTPQLVGVPGFTSPGSVARKFHVFEDAITASSHLGTHVWDWEVTKELHLSRWWLGLAGGVRYAYLTEGYQALRVNSGSGTSGTSKVVVLADTDLVQTGHNFSGAGPTAALETRYPLGDSGFSLYGLGRGSVLFGRNRTQSFQVNIESQQTIPKKGATVTSSSTTTFRGANGHNDVLTLVDLEIGLEWSRQIGHARFFLQTGLVGSLWADAGNATSDRGDFWFFGMNLTAGISF
jgi:hypothetical protein